jgi:hypothetical protein
VIRLKVEGDLKWQVVPLNKASSMAADAPISTLQGPKTLAYDNEKIKFKTAWLSSSSGRWFTLSLRRLTGIQRPLAAAPTIMLRRFGFF